jgi:pre-rRNA-processing protein RIX1
MSLPLSLILQELESAPPSLVPILALLHRNKALLNEISPQDTRHLVARTLNLTRTLTAYAKWCGVNLIYVLCENHAILAEHGAAFIAQLLKLAEQAPAAGARAAPLLRSAVECLNKVCAQIRGKPTLTRELLTPRLPAILLLYLARLEDDVLLFVPSLRVFLGCHPTTFRPFGDKLRARLVAVVGAANFKNRPEHVRHAVMLCLAALPAIEKVEPEQRWARDVAEVVRELLAVVLIYREFLDFLGDAELGGLIERLGTAVATATAAGADELAVGTLAPLSVSTAAPALLLAISDRVDTLCSLLAAYLTTRTAYAVRVPVGMVLAVCDVVCLVNTRFLAFTADTHDARLRHTVALTLQQNHLSVCRRVLGAMPLALRGLAVPHLVAALGQLEVLLPFARKRLDRAQIVASEYFVAEVLRAATAWLELTASLSDASAVVRLVEAALVLVEPRAAAAATAAAAPAKRKRAKPSSAAPALADLLSHQHLFAVQCLARTTATVRRFLNAVLKRVALAPTHYYKVLKYVLVEAARARQQSLPRQIPPDLRALLVDAVLYPGSESVSVLPLVSTLLEDDEVISVFNHPRFPPLARVVRYEEREDEEEGEESDTEGPEWPEGPEGPDVGAKRMRAEVPAAAPAVVPAAAPVVPPAAAEPVAATDLPVDAPGPVPVAASPLAAPVPEAAPPLAAPVPEAAPPLAAPVPEAAPPLAAPVPEAAPRLAAQIAPPPLASAAAGSTASGSAAADNAASADSDSDFEMPTIDVDDD